MSFLVGLDPGGSGAFGWCVSRDTDRLPLGLEGYGVADHAEGAVNAVLRLVGLSGQIVGLGIDSPLFWTPAGDRKVDKLLRQNLRRRGGPVSAVMSVNSLQGACLVQGVLAGQLLRNRFPAMPVTEAHPKVLLWLLDVIGPGQRANEVAMSKLSQLAVCDGEAVSEHIRDAALAAVTAWAMLHHPEGWRDIATCDGEAMCPWNANVSYWMPVQRTT